MRRLIDGEGRATEWQRDEQGRVQAKVFADGSQYTYAYDYSGRLITETDPLDRTKDYTYTLDDKVSAIDYSDSNTPDVSYSYDTYYGRVSSRTDGPGTTSYVYNANDGSTLGAGQVARINGPLTDDTLKYTYDELGRVSLLEVVDDSTYTTVTSSEAYAYDARGRVTEVENNLGPFAYSYVGQSNRVSTIEYPNGQTVEYAYEGPTGEHVLKTIKNKSSAASVMSKFEYTYNQDRTISTWKQTIDGTASTWSYTYDEALQLIGAQQKDPSNTLLEAEHYGYDQAQNRIQVTTGTTTSPSTRSYKVNNLNQLVAERGFGPTTFGGTLDEKATVTVNGNPARVSSTNGSAPYRFEAMVDLPQGTSEVTIVATDGNENQTSKTYEVTTTGTTTLYVYDDTGNLRYEQEPNETTRKEYQWDQENRLVKVIEGTTTTEMEYDGQTRRTRIRVLESGVEQSDYHFVWCGSRICEKRDGSSVAASYFWQGVQTSGTNYFYAKDHLGSIWEVVGENGTTIASRTEYDPWGRVTSTGAGYEAEVGYTGHLERDAGNLVLAQYRGYDPYLGRWLSRDPLGAVDGPNVYAYVRNRPTTLADLLGLFSEDNCPPDGACKCGPDEPWFHHYKYRRKRRPGEGSPPSPGVPGPQSSPPGSDPSPNVPPSPKPPTPRPPNGQPPDNNKIPGVPDDIADILLNPDKATSEQIEKMMDYLDQKSANSTTTPPGP